jgi:hypothetical protein
MNSSLLSVSITTISISAISMGKRVGGNVGGLHRLTDGLGDGVLHGSAGHLGDNVAVLDLNGHALHLGVVHTVLGGDLTASVLDSCDSRVGNSMSNRGHIGGMGIAIVASPVSLSIGLSLSLVQQVSGKDGCSRGIAENINNILADLLVLNLLGGNGLSGAHILGGGSACLGGQDLVLHLAVGGVSSQVGGSCQQLGVSIRRGSSLRGGSQTENHKELKTESNLIFYFACFTF